MVAPSAIARRGELTSPDTDPVVSKPVGIALKYAGVLDEPGLLKFLDEHAGELQRPALRYAVEKLQPSVKAKYLR